MQRQKGYLAVRTHTLTPAGRAASCAQCFCEKHFFSWIFSFWSPKGVNTIIGVFSRNLIPLKRQGRLHCNRHFLRAMFPSGAPPLLILRCSAFLCGDFYLWSPKGVNTVIGLFSDKNPSEPPTVLILQSFFFPAYFRLKPRRSWYCNRPFLSNKISVWTPNRVYVFNGLFPAHFRQKPQRS